MFCGKQRWRGADLAALGLLFTLGGPGSLQAREVSVPSRTEALGISLGLRSRSAVVTIARSLQEPNPDWEQIVQSPEASWLRLRFGSYNLGRESYVLISSLIDGSRLPNHRHSRLGRGIGTGDRLRD